MSGDRVRVSYAPNYDVPENVSPFMPLPLLALCAECRTAFPPLRAMNVVSGGTIRRGLCPTCAGVPTPPETASP